ncbi:hypothetical protein Pan216_05020 [Planctomycetes bacterium Pan216]|uniref:DUF58 domain-containing protein n=1 Tax=Kolteria novifilia TaxID=2527975 RepID=A0A518AYA3_9BACT|nr:hypothetical protein Pan216_05020 [Planctomycetes bacterium Pan216]
MPQTDELLSPDFIRRLERLELVSRRLLAGRLKGERRSKRRGTSHEFADHRPYVMGDDLRFIDWNILVRLDRLFIKLFEEEEDLHVFILIDASGSMDFGEPSKLQFASKVAAALAFIGLTHHDRLSVIPFGDDLGPPMPAARGRQSFLRVREFLSGIEAKGGGDLTASMRTFMSRHQRPGLVVLISDLLDKEGYDQALRYLLARQMDIQVIHVLSVEEIDPPVTGDLRLVDCEDGDMAEITVTAPLLNRYRAEVGAFREGAKEFCGQRGMGYLAATNQTDFEGMVLSYFRRTGLIK